MSELPKRKTIRLKDYDYAQAGYYFITICSYNRKNLFGSIDTKPVGQGFYSCCNELPSCKLTKLGEMISQQWLELQNMYPHIELDKFTIMPNHMHGIIIIRQQESKNKDARQEQSPCQPFLQTVSS